MDYFEIGQQVRKYRRAYGMSQEQLAEKVGISVTHMSHIETGNTKLSLPVLVALAQALEVRTDDLIFKERPVTRSEASESIEQILQDCSVRQMNVLIELLQAAKISMNKYF